MMNDTQELFMEDGTVLVQIPEYPDYFADLELGVIYSARTGIRLKRLKAYKRPGIHDYVTTTLINQYGESRCMGVHEYVMAAREQSWDWKEYHNLEVDHINEVKSDNRSDNLQLTTRLGQYTQSVREKMGLKKRGSNHPSSKLDENDVLEIRERFAEWDEMKREFAEMIAEEYGVSISCVNGIIYGNTWTHL